MLDIAIVDDDNEVVEKLKSYVDKYFQEAYPGGGGVDYKVSCFSDGVNFLSSAYGRFDIVFMDINMPIKDGIEVAEEFRKNNETACLVFVTKMANMAIKGYEVGALDFLIKPVVYDDFSRIMERAVSKTVHIPQDCIIIVNKRLLTKLPVKNIIYAEAIYHRIVYHTVNGEISEWSSMTQAEARLSDYGFVRCNSGYLVNLRYVDKVIEDEVKLGNITLGISRNRRSEFLKKLTAYLGAQNIN